MHTFVWVPKEIIKYCGTRVTGGYEILDVGAENQTPGLCKRSKHS